jgi:hypothetical protein
LLLQETPPRVELIDPKTLKVVASIDLAVEERGEIARAWSNQGVAGRRSGAAMVSPRGGGTAALLDAWRLGDLNGKLEGLAFTARNP